MSPAQYSPRKQQGSETLRLSARVSGSGSEGRVRAKHHNTRDNGGFMPHLPEMSRGAATRRHREIRELGEESWADSALDRDLVGYSQCAPLVAALSLLLFRNISPLSFYVAWAGHAASRSRTWLGCKCGVHRASSPALSQSWGIVLQLQPSAVLSSVGYLIRSPNTESY